MKRYIGSILVVALLLAGLSTTSQFVTMAQAGTTQVEAKVISYNICGRDPGNCEWAGETTQRMEYVVDQIKAWPPDIVMLQEVCFAQYSRLKTRLDQTAAAGTTEAFDSRFHPKTDNASNCTPQNGWVDTGGVTNTSFGLAVFTRGTGSIKGTHPYNLGGQSHGGNGWPQPVLCVDVQLGTHADWAYACNLHSRAGQNPWDQRGRFAGVATLASDLDPYIYGEARPVILGGDLNSRPTDIVHSSQGLLETSLDVIYQPGVAPGGGIGSFVEADMTHQTYFPSECSNATRCRSGETTIGTPGGKLDYIFFGETTAPAGATPTPAGTIAVSNLSGDALDRVRTDKDGDGTANAWPSDHSLYRGRALFTVTK